MTFLLQNPALILSLTVQHLAVTGLALLISSAFAVPLSLLIAQNQRLYALTLGMMGAIYTIPSIALIILLIPLFGLGYRAVVTAVVLYTQVILVRNLVAGLKSIEPSIIEAAQGVGMNRWQRWNRVELPLALPVSLAGLRIAVVTAIAIATIGAKFGAGGLGTLLFEGIAQAGRDDKIWAGSLTVAALALLLNKLLLVVESRASRWRMKPKT